MKIWLASADPEQIEDYLAIGIFAGVITNPTVVAEAKRPPREFFREVCRIAPAVYYQLREGSADAMLAEAEIFLAIDPGKMRIKVPATRAGFSVIRRLSDRGLDVMATVVPTTPWLVFALAAGAKAIAAYGSTLQRQGQTGKLELILKMQEIIDRQKSAAELCVGVYDVTDLPVYAAHGVRSCFIWARHVEEFLRQPLIEEALAGFRDNWKAIEGY
jgi:transaldolase